MTNWNGAFSLEKTLNGFRSKALPLWLEAIILTGLGVMVVVLHQALRFPMQLPGRHGIEWMAILLAGRAFGRSKVSGTFVSLSASATSMLPIWGAVDDPFIWLIYLLPGLVVDLAFYLLPNWQQSLPFLVSLGALAHVTKPLVRWIVSLALGYPYGSFLWGVGYPMLTHLIFGAVGGLLAGILFWGLRKKKDA